VRALVRRTGGRAVGIGRASPVLAIAAVLLTASPPVRLTAQAVDRTKPPALPPPPALKLPGVQTATLPNGLELHVVEMHKVPVVDVQMVLDAGSVRDPADLPGLATFTATMLQQGAGRRGALEIADEAAFLGAQLGTSASYDLATASLHVPKQRLEAGLDLLADVVLRPTFPDSEIARQRELRRAQIVQQGDNPVAMAAIAFPAILYGGAHPYGRPLGGTEASTAALARDRVATLYQAFYRPNGARMLVVGDVTLAEARRLVAARFAAWPRAEVPALAPATPPAATARTMYLVDKPGAAQSVVRIGHVGIARSNPDYFALQVLNTILGGAFTSRLNQNLRETRGYTYGAFSQFTAGRMAGPFVASASVVTAKTDSSLIEFLKELRGIRDEPVPEAELAKAKSYIALGLPGDFETTASAAARFRELLAYGLPLDYYAHYIERISAVTAGDVQRVARQYIDPDHFDIVVVGDKSQIEAGIKALNEGPIVYRNMWGQEVKP
jgi:zinc protease